jgi:hypothetical protein
MGKFLLAYFNRTDGRGNLATICSDVNVEEDRMSSDPAALSDWQECVSAVLAEGNQLMVCIGQAMGWQCGSLAGDLP